jgi:hypothetical protein
MRSNWYGYINGAPIQRTKHLKRKAVHIDFDPDDEEAMMNAQNGVEGDVDLGETGDGIEVTVSATSGVAAVTEGMDAEEAQMNGLAVGEEATAVADVEDLVNGEMEGYKDWPNETYSDYNDDDIDDDGYEAEDEKLFEVIWTYEAETERHRPKEPLLCILQNLNSVSGLL